MEGRLNSEIASTERTDPVKEIFTNLLDIRARYDDEAGLSRLRQAFEFGRKAHEGQTRESGEPYFTHPLHVACLLAEMRLDIDTLITALLHDTVEDCNVTLQDIRNIFGDSVAMLVDGVTKLSRLELQSVDTKTG